jgi:hypothetical protein
MANIIIPTERANSGQNFNQNIAKKEVAQRANGASYANVSREQAKNALNTGVEDDIKLVRKTSIEDRASLLKRARAKYFTRGYLIALIRAAERCNKSEMSKAYWNSWYCANELTEFSSGKISSKYCKNKFCLVCARIRTAKLINQYKTWFKKHEGNLYMLTLTRPTVDAYELPKRIDDMMKGHRAIIKAIQKQKRRNKLPRLEGLRKLECTSRPGNMFHPHYHIVIVGKENAELYRDRWLERFEDASAKAQDISKCKEGSEMELFKYFTKIITSLDGEKVINANQLDVIFNAVKGKRTFQPVGFKMPKAKIEEAEPGEEDYAIASWIWDKSDWVTTSEVVDMETAEVITVQRELTGYKPSEKLKELIEEKVIFDENYTRNSENLINEIEKVSKTEKEANELAKMLEKW